MNKNRRKPALRLSYFACAPSQCALSKPLVVVAEVQRVWQPHEQNPYERTFPRSNHFVCCRLFAVRRKFVEGRHIPVGVFEFRFRKRVWRARLHRN